MLRESPAAAAALRRAPACFPSVQNRVGEKLKSTAERQHEASSAKRCTVVFSSVVTSPICQLTSTLIQKLSSVLLNCLQDDSLLSLK